MIIEQGSFVSMQDGLIETQKMISSLRDLANVLQYGFSAIHDDNVQFTTSSLWIIEKQLIELEEKLSGIIKTLDTMSKEV